MCVCLLGSYFSFSWPGARFWKVPVAFRARAIFWNQNLRNVNAVSNLLNSPFFLPTNFNVSVAKCKQSKHKTVFRRPMQGNPTKTVLDSGFHDVDYRLHWIPHALSGNLESRFQSLAIFRSPELYLGFQIPGFRIRIRTALNGATSPSGNYQDLSKWAPGWS